MNFVRQFLDALLQPIRTLLTSPQKLIATPRKLLALSVPARVAALLAIFLLASVVLVGTILRLNPTAFDPAWWRNLWIMVILVFVIPVVTYWALRLWLQGEASPFPDIDQAWEAGLVELERRGIDLLTAPLFVVIGSASQQQERALFKAAKLDLAIHDFPSGYSALRWYANAGAIYVVASEIGCLSKLAALGAEVGGDSSWRQPAPKQGATSEPAFNPRQTAVVGDPVAAEEPVAAAPAAQHRTVFPDIRGTMEIRQTGSLGPAGATSLARLAAGPIKLSREEAVERQPARLAYLCKLICRARRPLCPINGILTLLPYSLIQRGPVEGVEVQKAVHSDMNTLAAGLRLRCPVTALVVGLETEPGFHELIRRVGQKRQRENRFGKGLNVWDPATQEQLGALCLHACGAFEDWVYTLFKEKDGLTTPGNTKLFALLCKIRRLQSRLDGILVNGFAREANGDRHGETILFGGCYFAGTGDSEDQQAFVKSVFDKLPEQQEDLEWTAEALVDEERAQRFASWIFAVDGLMAAILAALLGWAWWHR
jgi:hypothetical protein